MRVFLFLRVFVEDDPVSTVRTIAPVSAVSPASTVGTATPANGASALSERRPRYLAVVQRNVTPPGHRLI
ncbi:hypothetical protein, partial [Actinotignum timonense]|uniref:hypothetical protein n=1 Tax=Actinotignum timonense TaxID=1870995 RepID=UPI002A7FDA4C